MFAELLQPTHLILLVAVLFLVFGGRWFTSWGRGFKDAIRNFRSSIRQPKQ
jgi:Sec-independent protein translocase protein TatA